MARHLTTLAATPVVVLALIAAAGCGGSSPTAATTTTTTTSTTSTASGSAATAAFRACLAKAGVKLPSGFGSGRPPQGAAPPSGGGQPPQGGGPPAFSEKQRKAFAACQSKLPAGARQGGGFPNGGQNNPALAKYTNCLRKHGVTFGGSSNQSAFKKASAACAKYAPTASG